MLNTLFSRRRGRAGVFDHAALTAIAQTHAVMECSPDGLLLRVNANLQRMLGYTADALVGRHHRQLLPPADAAGAEYTAFWSDLAGGASRAGRFRYLDSLGREVWYDATFEPILNRRGQVVRVVASGTDVTLHAQRESDMAAQVTALARSQAVIAFDLQGRILDANDGFLQVMGYARDEVLGQHHRMFVGPQTATSPAYREFWQRLGQGQYDAAIYRRIAKGGREVWIQATYNPIFDHDGRPCKVIKFATDITRQIDSTRMVADAVGRMTDTVRVNATYAEDAEQRTRAAAADAGRAGQDVAELVSRLSTLASESTRISRITTVIDGIAFQTNLLALNAAVQAAHAGQHGRGFAVIAGEIRELSQRSAASAREIAALIDGSVQQIDAGQRRAAEVGAQVQALIASVNDVGAVMARITTAASEQTAGISRVQTAIADLENARTA